MIKNKLYVGLLVGFIIPFVGYAILLVISEALGDLSAEKTHRVGAMLLSKRLLQLLAIFLLILPMQYFSKRRFNEAMRGLSIPLMFYCAWWIYTYFNELF